MTSVYQNNPILQFAAPKENPPKRQPNEVAACAQTDLTNMFRDCAFDGNKFVNLSLRKLRFLPP